VRVLSLLGERGIRAIPYKGPVLASLLYGNLAQREYVDLDLLVSPARVADGKDALLAAGYQPSLPLTARQEAALLRSNCELMFKNPERQSAVELHWHVAPGQFAVEFDFEELWERRRRISLGGSEVATLADEDLLLVLAVHAAKHLWECLCWTRDISELVAARPGPDWERAVRRAQELGVLRFLLLSLDLSRELLGTPLPEMVGKAIAADPKVGALAAAVRERMWAGESSGVSLGDHWLLLRARERWRDKARYARRLLFTPGVSEWKLLELPAPLWPLYPAIRVGRVVGKLVRGLWPRSASAAATPLNQSPPPPRS
ncbi:MAG: nucleotidyltransferase domain-containing protein, partial [Terriglobales bacterium]